jgi:hypothetical protein
MAMYRGTVKVPQTCQDTEERDAMLHFCDLAQPTQNLIYLRKIAPALVLCQDGVSRLTVSVR